MIWGLSLGNFIKKGFYLILFGTFLYFMLFHAKDTVAYARQGLLVWFQTMIPTLLPFMILTSMSIQLKVHRSIVKVAVPVFQRIYQINTDGIYCIVFGFLCGFPMGARIVAQLQEKGYLSKEEGSYLLSFCNNIGPIYFTSIVLTGIRSSYHGAALLGMYGIPLLYGIVLRHTLYRHMHITTLPPTGSTGEDSEKSQDSSLFLAMDDSITSALQGITMLGGYMIFFNLCTSIPTHILSHISNAESILLFVNCFLEISSGIQNVLSAQLPTTLQETMLLSMVMLGGISCLAQTISCIRNIKISVFPYCIHKILQSILFYLYMQIIYHLICINGI